MYGRRPTRPKPRQSQPKRWPAPTAGWVANRALADPSSIEGQGAAVLDNFIPRSTSVALRRGKQRYATLVQDGDVTALFSYRNGTNERLFSANDSTIYDLTTVLFPDAAEVVNEDGLLLGNEDGDYFGFASTLGLEVSQGYTSGQWMTAQFATTGGVYLIGVNGVDDGFIYDGDVFYPYVAGGVTRLPFDTETSPIAEGGEIIGATSNATATVWRRVQTSIGAGYLLLTGVTGTFVNDEAISDAGDGTAKVNGTPSLAAPGLSIPDLTTANMAFVWTYKNRLWFAERDSMNAWYVTEPDAVGGAADVFPLAGVFTQGGALLFGAAWSLDSSGDAGLSEQCVFVSTLGEVAVYQGANPNEAGEFGKVGIYKIGTPLGRRAFVRGGGDIAIATTVGLVPLSKAISLDVTALNVATVSYKIADAWSDAVTLRGPSNWVCEIWPEGKLAIVAPPDMVGSSNPVMFVSNTETGAWGRFTNWQALCMEVFRGRLFFGSPGGVVYLANVGGNDDGATYTGTVLPLFEDLGASPSLKVATVARARVKASTTVVSRLDMLSDFDLNLPVAPDATPLVASNTWGSGVWGSSAWGDSAPSLINQDWQSVGGTGYSVSACYQVTSGAVAPLDAEVIDLELLFTTAGVVS